MQSNLDRLLYCVVQLSVLIESLLNWLNARVDALEFASKDAEVRHPRAALKNIKLV